VILGGPSVVVRDGLDRLSVYLEALALSPILGTPSACKGQHKGGDDWMCG
jgi:hypothetical protein